MSTSNALRVLVIGSFPGEKWLYARLTHLIPPAVWEHVSALEGARLDESARYDLILARSSDAETIARVWPQALICEPMLEGHAIHLTPFRAEQYALLKLVEQQLNRAGGTAFLGTEPVERFDVLREINYILGSRVSAETKLQQVLNAVTQLADTDSAAAFLLDQERQFLDVVAASSDCHGLIGQRVALEASVIGQTVYHSQQTTPIVLSSFSQPLAYYGMSDVGLRDGDEKLLPEGKAGVMCIPLAGQISSIGGILLYYLDQPVPTLEEATTSLLEIIASQTAIVIEDSRLFSAAQRMAEQMRLVSEVSREIAGIHELETILSVIPDRLTGTFGYYHASVGVVGPDGIEMYEAAQRSRAVGPERFHIPLDGRGIVPWVARRGIVHLSNDTRQDEIWLPGKGLEASRSELTVPLVYRERVIGVIDVQSEHLNAFDRDDISILEALAGQLAVAIENARLYDENHHQRQVAESLSGISRRIGSMLDVHEVSETALQELKKLLHFDVGMIALLNGDQLRLEHYTNDDTAVLNTIQWLVEKSPLVYQVLRGQEAVLIPDVLEHRLWQKVGFQHPIRSWLGVPLLSRGKPIGVLAIASMSPQTYHEQNGELLFAFANQVAVTIDNAQLFEKTEWRERETRTLYEVTRLLVTLDEESIPASVLNKLGEVLPFEAGGMLLSGDPCRIVLNARRSVTEAGIEQIEERLINAYNAVSGEHLERRSVQRRVVLLDSESDAQPIDRLPARLSAPLLIGHYAIGVIELGHSNPVIYDEPELRTLLTITNTTATALENAHLYAELMERAVNLQMALDELAEADRLKDELVQHISHELRSPLTYIAGYVSLLLDGAMGEIRPEQRDSLEIIATKTQAMARLIEDILLSERKPAEVEMNLSPVNIASLAEQAVQGVRAACEMVGIQINCESDQDIGNVMANPDRIMQVFDNLLGNALKFSSSGDTITVRVISREDQVHVDIEDTGIGIPADKLPRVFERFYQVEASRRRSGGVGLGLAICKQIVEAHGGSIGVHSEEGIGSTFYFELPKAPAI